MTERGYPPARDDHTALNCSTYDRIAARYFAQQIQPQRTSDNLFSSFEDAFVSKVPRGGIVGDMGCGPGLDAARLVARGFHVVGVDLSAGMLAVAAERLSGRVVQGDLRALPLAANQLDAVWCVASLLHVPEHDTSRVLLEFKRTLRKNGVLGLVTALGEGNKFEDVAYAAGEHRWFVYRTANVILQQLETSGFEVEDHSEVTGSRRWFMVLANAG